LSITIFLGTPDRIVAACDSRARDGATYRDDVKKIDIDKGAMVGATARGGYVMDAWQRTAAVSGESSRERAERVLTTLQRDYRDAHEDKTDIVFGVCRFAKVPSLYVVKAAIAPGSTDVKVVQDGDPGAPPFVLALGGDDCDVTKAEVIQRDILPLLYRRLSEAQMISLAREIIGHAAKESPKVGGPVHVAVLDAGGSRWI
jgi:hypothetical protein